LSPRKRRTPARPLVDLPVLEPSVLGGLGGRASAERAKHHEEFAHVSPRFALAADPAGHTQLVALIRFAIHFTRVRRVMI
jgi:hypothetical protein